MIATFRHSYSDSTNNIYEEDVTGRVSRFFTRVKTTPADVQLNTLHMTIGCEDYEIRPSSEITFHTRGNEMYVLSRADGGYCLNGIVYATTGDLYQRLQLIYRNEDLISGGCTEI